MEDNKHSITWVGPRTFSSVIYTRAGSILQNEHSDITHINRSFIVCCYALYSHWVYSITLSAWVSEIWPHSKHKSEVTEHQKCFNQVKGNELKMLIYDEEKFSQFFPPLLWIWTTLHSMPFRLAPNQFKYFIFQSNNFFKASEIQYLRFNRSGKRKKASL